MIKDRFLCMILQTYMRKQRIDMQDATYDPVMKISPYKIYVLRPKHLFGSKVFPRFFSVYLLTYLFDKDILTQNLVELNPSGGGMVPKTLPNATKMLAKI